jgi:hypothetical protein
LNFLLKLINDKKAIHLNKGFINYYHHYLFSY